MFWNVRILAIQLLPYTKPGFCHENISWPEKTALEKSNQMILPSEAFRFIQHRKVG